jgi:hypothetical protein
MIVVFGASWTMDFVWKKPRIPGLRQTKLTDDNGLRQLVEV